VCHIYIRPFCSLSSAYSWAVEVAGPTIRIEVHDTGEGIPPDKLRSIFEPFAGLDARNLSLSQGRRVRRVIGQSVPPLQCRSHNWRPTRAHLRSAAIQSDRAPTRRVSISHAYGLPAIVAARGGRRGFGEKSLTTTLLSLSNGDERMTYRRVSRNRQKSR
jgi:hypothetical protein